MKISQSLLHMQPSATRVLAEKAKELKAKGVPVISFTTGEPDFRSPEASVRYAAKAMAEGNTFYTATAGIKELKDAVADYYNERFGLNYENDQIIIGPGSKPLIFEALGAIIDPGDEVIITAPSWVSYVEQTKFFGGKPVIVETKEKTFEIDADMLRDAVTSKTVAIILNSPNNPTGVVYDQKTMEDLCNLARVHDITIINDEVYERITFDGFNYRNPLCYVPEAGEHVLNFNGVSKAYAMTGWRIGFALGPRKLVNKMSALQGHLTSGACSIAQWAALGAIREAQKEVEDMVAEYQKRKEIVTAELDQFPLISYAEPQGAFYVFIDIRETIGKSAGDNMITDDIIFSRELLEKNHVAVIPGTAFLLPGHIRISFATSQKELRSGLKRMKAFLETLS